MPSEVRRVLLSMGSFPFMKYVGQYFKHEAWTITGFPEGQAGFSRLGLRAATGITKKPEDWRG